MLKYSHIVWDWNGTLFDDVDWCIAVKNRMLKARGLPLLDRDRYRGVFGFPVRNYYEALGYDFEKESFETLAEAFISAYHEDDTGNSPLCAGAPEVLESLSHMGVLQCVLSASKAEHLLRQMSRFGIRRYFDEVLGLSDIYAKSKVDVGLDYLARANAKRVLLIGDTLHDYEVARALGADCLLLTRGHQSRERLSLADAALIDTLYDVPKYIKG